MAQSSAFPQIGEMLNGTSGELFTQLRVIYGLYDHLLNRALPPNWTVQQVLLLAALQAEPSHIGALAVSFHVSQPTMSEMLRRLEKRGLILVTTDQRDRRKREVALTAAGRRVLKKLLSATHRVEKIIDREVEPELRRSVIHDLTRLRVRLNRVNF